MTINPIVAGLLAAAILSEPITLNVVVGLIAVCIGLFIATTEGAVSFRGAPKARSRNP